MTGVIKKCPKCGVVHDVSFVGDCESCFSPLQYYCRFHNEWLVDDTCNRCGKPTSPRPAATPVSPPAPAAPPPGAAPKKSFVAQGVGIAVISVAMAVMAMLVFQKATQRRREEALKAATADQEARQRLREAEEAKATDAKKNASQAPAPKPAAPQPASSKPPATKPASTPQPMNRMNTPLIQPRPAETAPPKPPEPPMKISVQQIMLNPGLVLDKNLEVTGTLLIKEQAKTSFDISQDNYTLQVKYGLLPKADRAKIEAAALGAEITAVGKLVHDPDFNSYYILATQAKVRQ